MIAPPEPLDTRAFTAVASRPVRGYTTPDEAAELGRLVAADDPQAIGRLERIVACATGAAPRPKDELEAFRAHHDAAAEAGHWRRRGRGLLVLAELAAMTGERRWADEAGALLRELPVPPPVPDDDSDLAVLPWHPGCPAEPPILSPVHALESLAVALPLLWEAWDAATRAYAIAYMALWAELQYRGLRDDPPFNIPLHGLVAALGAGLLFPDLPRAERWVGHIEKALGEGGPYDSRLFMTPDGYAGEGFGYQKINTLLLARALALLDRCRRAAPEALRRNSAAAFEFVAATLRPDGATFLVGDASGASPWEPETHPCHLLHLGAALFGRPDWKARAGNVGQTPPRTCLFFLMGLDAYRRWRAMPRPDIRGRTHAPAAFTDSGFFHLKAGRGAEDSVYGMLNASLAHNHAHHDCLSVAVFAAGRELVCDPGGRDPAPRSHALCRLGHLTPAGPRHVRARVSHKAFAASPCGRLQFACGEHDLNEGHRQRRALMLCLPDGAEAGKGFWIVWDRIVVADTPDGAEPPPAPLRVVETIWPLHAPGGTARVAGLACWSCHAPSHRPRGRRDETEQPFTSAQAHAAIGHADSDGNIQVAALPLRGDAVQAPRIDEGQCHHFRPDSVHPVGCFDWRGRLPHEAAYVLAPFRGLVDKPPWRVDGWCADPARPGVLEARLGPGDIAVRAEGLIGPHARVEMTTAGGDTCILVVQNL